MKRTGISRVIGMVLLSVLLVGTAATARAQKAAIVAAVSSSESGWVTAMTRKITDTGLYPGGVDYIPSAFGYPSLAQLSPYNLIVVFSSDYGLGNGPGLGRSLGDYLATVPAGGVLLFDPFTWQTGLTGAPAISDKFLSDYALTTQSSSATASVTKRGTVLPNDPLTVGVPDFACGSTCYRLTGLTAKPGATVSAYWDDGSILAVRGPRRVDLNMLPADDTLISGSYKPAGGTLITNAILYLGSAVSATPSNVSFAATALGASSVATTITFKNPSIRSVDVIGLGLEGTGKAQFNLKTPLAPSPASPLTLAGGASFTVEVRFRPQDQGTHQASLYVDLATSSRTSVSLTGESKGSLYLVKSPVDFGGIATGATAGPVTVRILNTGSAPVDLDKPVLADTTHYELGTPLPDAKVTLIKGASYSFTVKFTPGMTPGQFPTQVTVTSTDPSSPLVIPVLGMAGPPKLQISATSLVLPDVPLGSMGTPIDLTLANTGNSELSVTSITSSADDFTIPNAPTAMSPLNVAPRESAVFQIVFTPKARGLRTAALTLKSNEPPAMGMMTSDRVVNLVSTGTVPQLRVDTTQLDFGSATFGKSVAPKTVTLYNDGDGALRVKEVSIPMGMGIHADSFSATPAAAVPFVLHAGASIPIDVAFVPKQAGMLGASLRIVTDLMGMGGTAAVALKGEANGSIGQISATALEFGDQRIKLAVMKAVTLTNKGNKPLTVLRSRVIAMMGEFTAALPADNTVVMPGASLSIAVTANLAAIGAVQGRLEIETDDPTVAGGTKFSVNLSANGVVNNVSITPALLDFTPPIYVGQTSLMQVFTIRNTGSIPIDNLIARMSGSDAADFRIAMAGKSKLQPGESTDIGIVFAPRFAKTGHQATAVVEADGVQAPMQITLKGSSLAPVITLQPSAVQFEPRAVGELSQAKQITLINESSGVLELEVLPPAGGEFVLDTSQAVLKMKPGDVTKLSVVFAPQSVGAKTASIDVRLKGSSFNIDSISLQGLAITPKAPPPEMTSGCSASPRSPRSAAAGALLLILLGAGMLARRRWRSGLV